MDAPIIVLLAREFFFDLLCDYMPVEIETLEGDVEPIARYLLFLAYLTVCKRRFIEMGEYKDLMVFDRVLEDSFFTEIESIGRRYSLKPSGFVIDEEEMKEMADYADIPVREIGGVATDLTTFLTTVHSVRHSLYLQDLRFHASPPNSPRWHEYAMLVRHVFRQMGALNLGPPLSPLSPAALESTCKCMVRVDSAARRKAKRLIPENKPSR